jgi:hypothetical protein
MLLLQLVEREREWVQEQELELVRVLEQVQVLV